MRYSSIAIAVLTSTQVKYAWHGRRSWGEFNIPCSNTRLIIQLLDSFWAIHRCMTPRNISNRGVVDGRVEQV